MEILILYSIKPVNQYYLNKPTISPRLGFTIDLTEDRSVVMRGGSGIFVGRIPFAWLDMLIIMMV
jgi:hypothetical protein